MRGRRIVGKQTVDPDLYPPPLLAGVTINQIAPNEALVTISTREATASEEAAPKVAEEPAAADALPTTTKTASSDSGSDSDSSDSDVAMSEGEGESSGSDQEGPCEGKARGQCGQYVFPCPREYASNYEDRKKLKVFKPSDIPKAEMAKIFKQAFSQCGHSQLINKMYIFDEPHKRRNKKTQTRERCCLS